MLQWWPLVVVFRKSKRYLNPTHALGCRCKYFSSACELFCRVKNVFITLKIIRLIFFFLLWVSIGHGGGDSTGQNMAGYISTQKQEHTSLVGWSQFFRDAGCGPQPSPKSVPTAEPGRALQPFSGSGQDLCFQAASEEWYRRGAPPRLRVAGARLFSPFISSI